MKARVGKIARVLCASLLLAVTISALPVYALTSDFTVRTLVGDDTTPPSMPTGLTATPVAMTQIDLAWNASTDDYIFGGYQVFRDGVQIATTTATTYSDTGLYASTTYSYFVTAFDSFFNYSASSSLVSTTTFATPTPPTTPVDDDEDTGPVYGTRIRLPELTSLEVIPTQYGALIRFETEGYVRSVTRWGTSISYELGSSAERSFSRYHEITITDLTPGTRYRFSIEGENHMGRFGVLTESEFLTLPADDVTPPGNVMNFRAVRNGNDVELTWENPRDPDFERVRILRGEQFFPSDTADGWVIFDGDGQNVKDSDVLIPGKRIYYTAFTYDAEGNISSGAVVSIVIGGAPLPIEEEKNEIELTLDDIDFYQEGLLLTPTRRGDIVFNGGRHLTIAIPYEALPEHLKTILVTLAPKNEPDTSFSFLLRINPEKTAYTARLAPLSVAGTYSFRVSVFDFKTSQIGYTSGTLTSVISTYDDEPGAGAGTIKEGTRTISFVSLSYLLLFVLFLVLLAFLSRRLLRSPL